MTVAGMHDKSLVVAKPGFFQRYANPPPPTTQVLWLKVKLLCNLEHFYCTSNDVSFVAFFCSIYWSTSIVISYLYLQISDFFIALCHIIFLRALLRLPRGQEVKEKTTHLRFVPYLFLSTILGFSDLVEIPFVRKYVFCHCQKFLV